MILSAQSIRKRGIITPFYERTLSLNGMTYGLGPAGYDIRAAEDVILYPKDFVLGSSIEHFDIPNDISVMIHDKSSWARKGLDVKNTVAEPGWRGFLTLEYTNNHVTDIIRIKRGNPIAQIVFHMLDEPTDHPYRGKYQDQPAGPQSAIDERS